MDSDIQYIERGRVCRVASRGWGATIHWNRKAAIVCSLKNVQKGPQCSYLSLRSRQSLAATLHQVSLGIKCLEKYINANANIFKI